MPGAKRTMQDRQRDYAQGFADGKAGRDPSRPVTKGIGDNYGRGWFAGTKRRAQDQGAQEGNDHA